MITIDSYTKFTESLKETGVLSKDFHIIQYSDGCCLGVDGKSKEFEDEALENSDYILWDKYGIAYRTIKNDRPGVVIGEDGVSIQRVPKLFPCPPLNHPQASFYTNEAVFCCIDTVYNLCREDNRSVFFMCTSPGGENPTKVWVDGIYNAIGQGFINVMVKNDDMRQLINKAVLIVNKDEPKNRSTES